MLYYQSWENYYVTDGTIESAVIKRSIIFVVKKQIIQHSVKVMISGYNGSLKVLLGIW